MKLINHVLDIRHLIQQAFDNRFSRMGLRADAPVDASALQEEQKEKRVKLEEIMQSHLKETGGNYAVARQATINECVFTLFNRIAAIKVMEAKELFPEIITRRKENAGRSFEHNAWLEEHPEERGAEREGLKHFLNDQFDRLGEHIPLYRSDYPYALLPTADELNEIIEMFNAVEEDADCGADVWKGDDILGWLYENFNAVEKAALKQSGDKTEYDKVSLQSQVYTPAWVVKFLVDNTLGKAYLEMYPDSCIKEKYQIANAPDHQVRHPKDVREMRVLDPACGSGNFLIYAFSLLYDLYQDQMDNYGRDYSRRDIPKMIVEYNLYGMDLDERAAQITQIALFIKARVLGGHRSHWPSYTNVVSTHFSLPTYDEVKESFGYDASWLQRYDAAANKIWSDLSSAHKFGSLVRVEEQLDELAPDDDNHMLFSAEEMNSLFSGRNELKTVIHNLVDEWGKANSFSLLKSSEAKTFLDIISQKYDVVVANPPYTDSADFGKELKAFVEANYKKPYKFNSNLYACFIKRCCELAGMDGKVGMVNPPTFMYIKTFEDTRKFILKNTHINLFVEWGYLGMFASFARVDSAMFILEMHSNEKNSTFIKLNDLYEMKRKAVLFEAYDDYLNNRPNNRVYTLPQSKLKGIKSYPFIYWISDEFREKFGMKTIGETIKVASGISTGNNDRFIRYWWEIDRDDVSIDYKKDGLRWVRHAKGGPFNKWYGNDWVVILWGNNGNLLKAFVDENGNHKATIRNEELQLSKGITFCKAGSKGASFRLLEHNHTFDSMSPCVFDSNSLYYTIGIVNSMLCRYILGCLNPTAGLQAGDIARVPYVLVNSTIRQIIENNSKQNIDIKKMICSYSLVEHNYNSSIFSIQKSIKDSLANYYTYENALLTQILLNESVINKTVFEVYELSEHDKQMVLEKEGVPVGDLPVSSSAKAAYREWLTANEEFPVSDEVLAHLDSLEENDEQPRITDFDTLYQNNNEWEEFCIKHKMNPVEVWWQFKNANILPPQRTQTLAFELLT
ncbi:MAG: BREX-1 system adenine-specific DNA-methyltransferase PglX, partial [Prevotella sp.]|nr:BREX-1 system adenine-specific DNA-methyltransferase PglX [Prevotella sp.]